MEELGSFIVVIIGAVIAIINAAHKKKQQSFGAPQPGMSAARPQPTAPAAKPASMASMLPQQKAAPIQPTVHTHLEPDCETHDAPSSGSLGATSTEGKDPCHEAQLSPRRRTIEEETVTPGLTLEWSGDAMVKAFVMQEVLTRPCQRRAR